MEICGGLHVMFLVYLHLLYTKAYGKFGMQYEENPCTQLENEINENEAKLKFLRIKKISGIMARAKARWQAEGGNIQIIFAI